MTCLLTNIRQCILFDQCPWATFSVIVLFFGIPFFFIFYWVAKKMVFYLRVFYSLFTACLISAAFVAGLIYNDLIVIGLSFFFTLVMSKCLSNISIYLEKAKVLEKSISDYKKKTNWVISYAPQWSDKAIGIMISKKRVSIIKRTQILMNPCIKEISTKYGVIFHYNFCVLYYLNDLVEDKEEVEEILDQLIAQANKIFHNPQTT